MDKNYSFEYFFEDLKNGFQIYYTYLDCKFLIYKMDKNCYKVDLVEAPPKSPMQMTQIFTLKRVKEIFPFMKDIQYKTGLEG